MNAAPTDQRPGSRLWGLYESLAMGFGLSLLAALCLLWLPVALILNPLLPAALGRRVGRAAISAGFRFYLGCLRLFCYSRFDLGSLDQLRDAPPLVLVANHPSLLDAVLVISRLPNVVCVMKAGLMRNLLLGPAARLAGYIPNAGPLEVVLHAQRALAEGAHVLLFPEGSRTARPPMDRFNPTPVLIARRAGVAIQMLLIRFSSPDPLPYLGKHWPLWRRPRLPMRWRIATERRFEPSQQQPGEADASTNLTRTMERLLRQRLAESPTEQNSRAL